MRTKKNKILFNKDRIKKRKFGFSLIELVVVIAILAVLAALLAPALIHYVEDSRATSDTQSMDEVVNAVQIGMTNPEAYDELVGASVEGNVSCYIDGKSEAGREKEIIKVSADGTAYYVFGDDERLLDETPYTAAGNMRGVTITFVPDTNNDTPTYDLKNAVINKHVGGTTKLSDYSKLYNSVRQTVGDTITLDSNTYSNSEYTIFIRIGTTGGNQESAQDPVQVYGQYNGTNLPKTYTDGGTALDRDDTYTPPTTQTPSGGNTNTGTTDPTPPPVSGGDGGGSGTITPTPEQPTEPEPPSNVIPDGETYKMADGTLLNAGDEFPETPQNGDIYKDAYYEYHYNQYYEYTKWYNNTSQGGWGVRVLSTSKSSYGTIRQSIANQPVNTLRCTFYNCTQLIDSGVPVIPQGVTNITQAFRSCTKLKDLSHLTLPSSITEAKETFSICSSLVKPPQFSDGITKLYYTFDRCTGLKDLSYYQIPETVTDMTCTFRECTGLTKSPKIPSKVTTLELAYWKCGSLVEAPVLPQTLTNMRGTFQYCASLVNPPVLPDNVTNLEYVFENCTSLTKLPNIPTKCNDLDYAFRNCSTLVDASNVVIPTSVKTLVCTFQGCSSLTKAPAIGSSVTNIGYIFKDCTSLQTAPIIPSNVQNIRDAFNGCTALRGEVVVLTNKVTSLNTSGVNLASGYNFFNNTTLPITLVGSGSNDSVLQLLLTTANNGNVTIAS